MIINPLKSRLNVNIKSKRLGKNQIEIIEKLYNALIKIDSKLNQIVKKSKKYDIIKIEEIRLTPREAYFENKKKISIEKSVNHICGEFIIPYPPGIPLIAPGEIVTQEAIEKLMMYKKMGMQVIGMKDQDNIQIIEV